MNKIDDTGARSEYSTGALRENVEGKGRFDLMSPIALMRLAQWYELGAKKYKDRNWEKGMDYSRCVDAAFRHLTKYIDGWDDEDHLAAVAWNVFALMHYEREFPELNDLPEWNGRIPQFNNKQQQHSKGGLITCADAISNLAQSMKPTTFGKNTEVEK